ncbi:Aste57867_18545 [Aphanomyces stellatus]|uniref:Aste57867_18545 protein n=1 Tax=Aphanomyces stellatus TaxID=120398 RepID=A0A485LAD6_9STRA|nr:hypothetical protein As57867_018483 [Aphanomyces stellatus]VFT95281.1 Aste57867_18545 [Aphanomyces stellatus]
MDHVVSLVTRGYNRVLPWIGTSIGAVVLVLVVIDVLANNWAINDFVGNGLQFRTPVASAQSVTALTTTYTFGVNASIANLSFVGRWMTDYIVQRLAANGVGVYLLTAGTYVVTDAMTNCKGFAKTYANIDLNVPVKLATADDALTFLRGDALSHQFTDDLTANQPPLNASIATLTTMGFHPARVQAKVQLTTTIPITNTSAIQTLAVTYYRIYSKAYCTGCEPIAELGRGTCNFTLTYSDAAKQVTVLESSNVVGSTYDLGLLFHQTAYTTVAVAFKYVALAVAAAGFLASRKTVQWHEDDATKVETVWHKLVNTLAPKFFPHLSHAIRFDLFCFNSDVFVSLFVAGNLLDMSHALMYIREVNVYNEASPNMGLSLQLVAISTRLIWLNVGLLKLGKLAMHLVWPAAYCGQSFVLPFLNLSSVTALYLSAIVLLQVPAYIEYNNSLRVDVHNAVEGLDGTFVSFYKSFYCRGVPAISIGVVLNVACVLAVDKLVLWAYWRRLQRNSLARQAIYNSTSVICEFVDDVVETDKNAAATVMHVKARRLSTLQWYFMSHMVCFGLPEKATKKKEAALAHEGTHQDTCSVAQSESGLLHLLDANRCDVKSLAFNIKILRDTVVTIE